MNLSLIRRAVAPVALSLALLAPAGVALAATQFVDSAMVNGVSTNIFVLPNASITADVLGTLTGSRDYKGTEWGITLDLTTPFCANTADHAGNGTTQSGLDSGNFLITAPAIEGSYNANFKVNGKNDCTGNASNPFTLLGVVNVDGTAPSGGSITYTDGYYTAASVPITFSTGTDSGSGLDLATGKIQVASGSLSGGSCGSFGSFSDLASDTSGSYTDTSVVSGNCYMYQYVISDNAGNTATSTSADVAKVDTDAPSVNVPSDITAEAADGSGAVVSFSAGATDSVSGIASFSCTPAPGSTFPIGTTPVSCGTSDNAGNSASAGFNVIVQDTTAPTVTIPGSNPIALNDGDTFSDPLASVTASDTVDGDVTASVTEFSNDVNMSHSGMYHVVYHAVDAHGNVGDATLTVNVSDATSPDITVPADITAEATGPSGASVAFTVTANDNEDGAITPSCNYSSGDTFPLGTTQVQCSATDSSANTGYNTFNVTVQDTTAPAIDPTSDISVHATSASGAIVTYTSPNATDLVDGSLSTSCTPVSGSLFPIATTTVTCTVTDTNSNTANSTFDVGVYNNAPVLDPIADISTHGGDTVTATPNATDADGDTLTFSITGAPVGSNFDTSTGVFSWDTAVAGGTFPLTITVDDGNGGTASQSFSLLLTNSTTGTGGGSGGGGGGGGSPSLLGVVNGSPTGQVLGASTGPTGSTGGQVLGEATFQFTANLGYGSRGNDVMELQKILIAKGYLKIDAPTGWFGPLTLAAVKEYQAANSITATGFVGPLTRAALNSGL